MANQWGRRIVDVLIKSDGLTTRTQVIGDIVYTGRAAPGASTSAPVWLVSKLDATEGGEYPLLYPNGEALFTNAWDNRTTLIYS